MRSITSAVRCLVVLVAGLVTLLVPGVARAADVVSAPVAFEVQNLNRSELPCVADGATYTVAGRIVGPSEALSGGRSSTATLYLHEYSFGSFYWSFQDVAGYDYVDAMARAGHVSVIVDRLGYDASDHPDGFATCLGAHADMARQIVEKLRTGEYQSPSDATRFERIVLAGHSVGAVAAELAAYSFDDLPLAGLIVFNLANQGYRQGALQESFEQGTVCTTGGEPAEPGAPGGYAFYGQPEEDWQRLAFASARPEVIAAATRRRNRDPCGDVASLTSASVLNNVRLGEIAVPVLLLWGESDAVYQEGAGEREAQAFTGSPEVTYRSFAGAGHAMLLESAAGAVQRTVDAWLQRRIGGSALTSGRPARYRPGLRATTTPRRDGRWPWRFTTTGRLVPPPGIDAASACRGRVTVTVKRGRRTVSTRRAALRSDCRFRSDVTFAVRRRLDPPRGLRVLVRFAGNRLLLPRRTRGLTVVAG